MGTIRLPEMSPLDKVLLLLGKRRGIIIPPVPEGMDAIVMARKEPFLRALLRARSSPLPEGMMDYYAYIDFA